MYTYYTDVEDSLSIYIHWPFCVSKCPYCDFNSHVAKGETKHVRWGLAYRKSLEHFASLIGVRKIRSIYFGGGTPSLMAPHIAHDVIKTIDKISKLDSAVEITLEVNPTTIELGKFAQFRDAGINRVSIGVQSLRNDNLQFLGRAHDREIAMRAIVEAPKVFQRFSFDLMYALPGQTPELWRQELNEALSLAVAGHISLYQLMISKGTPFHARHASGEFVLPADEECDEMYNITRVETAKKQMIPYEISNYCIGGQESIHNMRYWQYYDYLGIGPGAHSRFRVLKDGSPVRIAAFCKYAPDVWMRDIENDGDFISKKELSAIDVINETLIMGLRMREGINKSRFQQITGQTIEKALGEKCAMLDIDGNSIKIRGEQVFVMDSILSSIIL